jgi:hypothetical protein
LGVGANYRVLNRFEEYSRGQIDIGNRMEMNKVSGRLFVHQHVVLNYVEIAQVRATYELGYEDFSREDDTASTFTLPQSGLFQTVRVNAGSGKLTKSNFAPKGWEVNVGVEATFRDDWRRWGPPNLWDSRSDFQKFQLDGTYVATPFADQKLVSKFTGGVGNGIDRLSAFKLGGSLTGWPNAMVLHGFYTREIFAEDFALINFDYVFPILKEQRLALHLYADGAITKRSDISGHAIHGWAGTGSGVSFQGPWETQWLFGYGYGINAQRRGDHGGHELFTQMSKQF